MDEKFDEGLVMLASKLRRRGGVPRSDGTAAWLLRLRAYLAATEERARVAVSRPPDEIRRQRELGWPDCHPEDFCHRCGSINPSWYTDRATWDLAVGTKWSIICPACLAELYDKATGTQTIWRIEPLPAERAGDLEFRLRAAEERARQLEATLRDLLFPFHPC